MYVHLSFYMTPIVIGYCWRSAPVAVFIFGGAIIAGGALALSVGSRSLLFLPVAFFGLGFVASLVGSRRYWALLSIVVLAIPAFYLSALIETVRKDGSKHTEVDATARLLEMYRMIEQAGKSSDLNQALIAGVSRMVVWSNWAALDLSPDPVPYRGFSDLPAEFQFLNNSTLFRDATDFLDEALERDIGLGAAKIYGFSVSAGGTVPFPVLADGWSRSGVLGVILLASILCCLFGTVERAARNVMANSPHMLTGFLAIVLSSSFEKMAVYGFVYNLRYLIMQVVIWFPVFALLSLLVPKAGLHQKIKLFDTVRARAAITRGALYR